MRLYCENQEFKRKQSEKPPTGHTVHRERIYHCEIRIADSIFISEMEDEFGNV